MKKLLLIFSLIILVSSCSQSEEKDIQNKSSIFGTWQLSESTANNVDGTPNDWGQLENGYKITFNEDFSYKSEINPTDCNEINSSTYTTTQSEAGINILEITIKCNNKNFTSKFSYSFENATHLILNPIEPACPEGCSFKYKKAE